MLNNIKCGRALIVQIICAGACVSGRSVSFSKCSSCALDSTHLNISFIGVNRRTHSGLRCRHWGRV